MQNSARSVLIWIGWVALIVFLVLYALAVKPFLESGLHLLPSASLNYSGHHYEHYGIPYAPDADVVYGSSSAASLAFLMVCTAPMVLLAVPLFIFRRIIYDWYEDSQTRRRAKTVALVLSVLVVGFSMYMTYKFVGWGTG